MFQRKIKFALVGFLILVSVVAVYGLCSQRPRRSDHVNESWETDNGMFKIRVTAYAEANGGFVGGAYYVFESASSGSSEYREILRFRHDDPVPIPRDQVRFLNSQVGFLFMGWKYAVTTDGGKNWTVWTADRDLPNWECCNYKLIADVVLEEDGTGTMDMNPIRNRRGEVAQLITKDFGKHWVER